jgi:hypothetical protein
MHHPPPPGSRSRRRRAAWPALLVLAACALASARADEPPAPETPAAPAQAAATLDLPTLEQRLRSTSAIGIFTKLSIKNQVDDLIAQFRAYHAGQPTPTLRQLRERFELLVLKVVTLLQDDDPALAAAVTASRDAIWAVLTDPKKFADI